jgi:hypothetical protein
LKKIYTYIILSFAFLNASDYIEAYGTIEDIKIHIAISVYDDGCQARYYYDSKLLDIQSTECKVDKNRYDVYVNHDMNDKTKKAANGEHFILNIKDDSIDGTWQNNSSKPKNVNLKISEKSYERFRNDNLSFSRDKIQNVSQNREIVWIKENHSEIQYPRLGNGFSKQEIVATNNILENIQKDMAIGYLTCVSRFDYESGMETTNALEFVGANFISIGTSDNYYCGGAHPDFGSYGILIELKSGKSYDIDEVLAFDVIPPQYRWGDSDEAFSALAKYRKEHFAPMIKKLVFESQRWDLNEKVDPDDCDYSDEEVWDFPSWYATKKGIAITPIFARVMRCCEESFVIPYNLLEKYKNPNFPYRLENIAR